MKSISQIAFRIRRIFKSWIYKLQKMFKIQKKTPFHQIIGATLLNVDSSKATYCGLNKSDPIISAYQFGFKMDKGYMSVENPFTLTINEKIFHSFDLEIFNILRSLTGSRVEQAWFEKEEINIIFNNAHLRISLKDEDFVSPEAGNFAANDNSTIIVFTGDD